MHGRLHVRSVRFVGGVAETPALQVESSLSFRVRTEVVMKGLFGIAVVVLFLTAAPSADAENVTINLSVCDADGGEETVPAGATLVLQETWADTRSAHVRRFLRLQDTTASVNNAPVANASSVWGPVAQEGSQYVTTWSYNTGVTL